ncbi:rRNA maturation RNase YbeY [Gemelliphila palaticanis]|uniref:Endoribonuclease YbeY n=1 Tax=Gemelliphila palaticanis TaxID=81950 RepID=A0ABX2SYE2_9BACL|nr:rRNA maturation RNase YbeY [Gemella palaticanis]MBF0715279.1 rRNA maturation RNase YbeY [Gemella palaticanis]NYS47209.1 rRNA maturation RNase YbeY [Gemella palaticanis]
MDFVEIIDEDNLISEKNKSLVLEILDFAAKSEKIDINNTELSVSFVGLEEIHSINKEYRGIDRPTDVISFALNDKTEDEIEIIGGDETNYLGDIIICVEKIEEQAKEYNHSFERELGFLAVHGFLHLLGYDHMTEDEEKIMFSKQNKILEEYGLLR